MLIERITSRQNPLVKRFRRVRMGAESHLLLLEGARLVHDALRGGVRFETIAFTSALESTERGARLLADLQRVPCRGALVTPQVMEAITDTETPQGVSAIVSRPHFELADFKPGKKALIVIVDQLQDPGNVGSIVRTAEAAGASAVIATRQTADPFGLKALRASMGSAMRLPISTGIKPRETMDFCRKLKLQIVATTSRPTADEPLTDAAKARPVRLYTDTDLSRPFALVLGQEGDGVSRDLAESADALVHIPMAAGVESLNVAAAAAAILFEAARQRRK